MLSLQMFILLRKVLNADRVMHRTQTMNWDMVNTSGDHHILVTYKNHVSGDEACRLLSPLPTARMTPIYCFTLLDRSTSDKGVMAEDTAADLEASAALTVAADRTSLCGPDVVVFNHKGPSVARTEIKLLMPGSEIIYGSVGGDFLWQCPNYDQTRKPVLEFLKDELFMSLHELSAPTILHSQLIVTAAQKIIGNKQEDCFQAPNLAWGTTQIKLTNTPRGFRVDFKGDNWIVFNNFVIGRVVVPGTTRELVNFYSVSTRKTYRCAVETANQCYPRKFKNEEVSNAVPSRIFNSLTAIEESRLENLRQGNVPRP